MTHTNHYAGRTSHANQKVVEDFESFNSKSTEDTEVSHPGGGREQIELEKPLLVAMAKQNRKEPECDHLEGDACVDAVFDEAFCDVSGLALDDAGYSGTDADLPKLRALMIKIVRGLNHYSTLESYISDLPSESVNKYGLEQPYGKSTYRKFAKELKKQGDYGILQDACFIAVHMLFCMGVVLPEEVKDRYNLSYEAGPDGDNFSDDVNELALLRHVDRLLDIIAESLTLPREGDNASFIRGLFGVFATAALTGESIEDYDDLARYFFNLGGVSKATNIRKQIDKLSLEEVQDMFDAVNMDLLKYVLESGVVGDGCLLAYDLTDIQSLRITDLNESFLTEDGRWRFASLAVTDSSLEFAIGLRLLRSERQRSSVLKNLLRGLPDELDVGLLMLDRGFDSARDIEVCRTFLPEKWTICIQDYSGSKQGNSDFERIREELEPGGAECLRSAGYSNLKPPTCVIANSGADESDETVDPVRAFYRDGCLGVEEIEKHNFTYNNRARIETIFRLAKNQFDIATDSKKPARKSFYFHISVLFYNIYKIVNTVPGPHSGIELDVTTKELRTAIQVTGFNGISPSPAVEDIFGDQ